MLRAARFFCILLLVDTVMVVSADPVDVIALDFGSGAPLVNVTLQWLETGQAFTTDANGRLSLNVTPGSNVTMNFPGDEEHRQTQGVTVVVPVGGLTNDLDEIVMQIPSHFLFDLFFFVTPGAKNESACQVVVTVCNVNKTVYDMPQGLPGTVAVLTPSTQSKTFYFGTWGKLSNDTNPFPNDLNASSFDGGVLFENIPPDPKQWYEVNAYLEGYTFSSTAFRCTQGGLFINGAPNQGPRATRVSF